MDASYLGVKPDHGAFAKWAKKRDIFLHPDVAFLVPTKRMGLGVYAIKPLKKGSTIISCPMTSAINPTEGSSVESPSIPVIAALVPATPGASPMQRTSTNTLRICLRLMAELCRAQSPLRPWLECCPRMSAHVFGLSDDIRSRLGIESSSDIMSWSNVGQQLREIHAEANWKQVQGIIAERPDIWPPTQCTETLFYECLTQVLSRNFHREEVQGQEGPYLLPGVDFINHSFLHTNAAFTMHGGGRARALSFDVMALRDIAKGEQVYYNYGPISEARFMLEFQFVNSIEGNPHDALRFSYETLQSLIVATIRQVGGTHDTVEGLQSDIAARIKDLRWQGLWNDEGIFVAPTAAEDASSLTMPQRATDDAVPASMASTSSAKVVESSTSHMGVCTALWNAVYLLTTSGEDFRSLSPSLSRHWDCPKTKTVTLHLSTMLSIRKRATDEAVERWTMVREDAEWVKSIGAARLQALTIFYEVLTKESMILAGLMQRFA